MATPVKSDKDFGSVSRILNLPASTAAGQPVVHEQLQAAIEGLSWKDSARVATQSNIDLSAPGATIDGITMVSADRVLVRNQTLPEQNGIYLWTGAATLMTRALDASTFDELEQATISVEEGTDADTSWRQTEVNGTLGADPVQWATLGGSVPDASETTKGKAEEATQAEVDAGSVTGSFFVSPGKLGAWAGRKLKHAANIGDGSATQYDVTHNFNTRDVHVHVFTNSGNYETVECDVERTSVNAVRIKFAAAPASNAYRVVILA